MIENNRNTVLIISKPLVPPWNDSSKNLAMGIVNHARQTRFHVFSTPGTAYHSDRISGEPIYRTAGSFAPSVTQNLRVLTRLGRPDREIGIYHFFFAPNPLTSTAARWITRFKRQTTIQTICSPPASYKNLTHLIFTDVVVVLSDYHLRIFQQAGITNVVKINPGVDIPDSTELQHNNLKEKLGLRDEKIILYPGDYEYSGGHEIILEILPELVKKFPKTKIIFACRPKTPDSRSLESGVKNRLREMGLGKYVIFLGAEEKMDELYGLTSACLFPAQSLYKKMDLPLTLLECLAWKIPIIIGDIPPVNELMKEQVGVAVKPDSPREVLEATAGLIGDNRQRIQLGENGRKMIEAEFDIKQIAAKYEDLYRECGRAERKEISGNINRNF